MPPRRILRRRACRRSACRQLRGEVYTALPELPPAPGGELRVVPRGARLQEYGSVKQVKDGTLDVEAATSRMPGQPRWAGACPCSKWCAGCVDRAAAVPRSPRDIGEAMSAVLTESNSA